MLIFVTGGAGYIGSHTVLELLSHNYDVVVADNCCNAFYDESNEDDLPESLKRVQLLTGRKVVKFVKLDLLDEAAIDGVFSTYNFDCVIHFAALKAVGESCQKPLSYYRNNIMATINVVEAMKKHQVTKLIFSSSATVYGNPEYLPIDEKHVTGRSLTNPYGKSKYFSEEMLQDVVSASKELCVISLRYFNPVGSHQSGEIGEDPAGIPNNLMPYVSQVAVGRRPYLSVYGSDFSTVDGTGVRDYVHIMDLASGHVAAVDKMLSEKWTGYHVYNLGAGRGYSVLEVVNAFQEATGIKVPYKLTSRREGDIDACYADCSKAKVELGWSAKYNMTDSCRDAWNWQSKYPYGYQTNNNNNNNGEEKPL
ncbi:UDP-glucose 4-epimerase [Halotydeus destructor]|nr:UDP-glucose 4-epimerase [Halotydeus destructor]